MSSHRPEDYRKIWHRKPVLQIIYADWYQRMVDNCIAGRTLEIGGGSGNLKLFAPNVLTSDILQAPWLDVVCDAQRLPFADDSFENIVLFDVLHHLEYPVLFFKEARRILSSGGRIILMEPGITPISHLFYHHFHEEPVDMDADPYGIGDISTNKDPFDANQAIPTLFFGNEKQQSIFQQKVPGLRIISSTRLAHFVYPLSGGFQAWSLLPMILAKPLLWFEDKVTPILHLVMSFRLLVVLQKSDNPLHP